jgi:hypothetical protein
MARTDNSVSICRYELSRIVANNEAKHALGSGPLQRLKGRTMHRKTGLREAFDTLAIIVFAAALLCAFILLLGAFVQVVEWIRSLH